MLLRPQSTHLALILSFISTPGCIVPVAIGSKPSAESTSGQESDETNPGISASGVFCGETTSCQPSLCQDGIVTETEQCDKEDLNGVTCSDLGFFGGQLTCSNSCTFNTSACNQGNISIEPQLNNWTPEFTPLTECSCTPESPECYTLYRGRALSQTGNTATLQIQKIDGTPPSTEVTFWIVVGSQNPTCQDTHAYIERTSGIWSETQDTLEVSVNIWPSEESFISDPCGATKDIFAITGGLANPNSRQWYQEQAIRFTKICT